MGDWILAVYFMAALVTACCALLVSRRASRPGALALSYLLATETIWSLGYAAELAAHRLEDKILWDNLQFIAWVAMLIFVVRFVWDYTGQAPRRQGLVMLLFLAVPVAASVWVLSDPLHGLARGSARIESVPPFDALLYPFSAPEQLLIAQTYGTMGYVTLSLTRFALQQHPAHRLPVFLVLLGLLLPTVANSVGITGYLFLLGQRDVAPYCFGLGALPLTWALLRQRFLDLVPIARHVVFEGIPDAVLVADPLGRVIDANPYATRLFGRAVGRTLRELLPTLDGSNGWETAEVPLGESVFEARSEALAMNPRRNGGRVVLLRDVTERKRAQAALSQARNALELRVQERTRELHATNEALERRIAEKAQAEQAARESERRFRMLFDNTYQLMGTLTPEGAVVAANRTALEFAGVSMDAVIGVPFWEGPWWSHSQELQTALKDAVGRAAGGELVRLQATHPDRMGELRHIDFSVKPIGERSGKTVELLAEGRDITELKRADEERTQLREQLHHSQKLESLGRLAGGVAHDFNNLLTVILGQIELAKLRSRSGERVLESLEQAANAAQNAASLTQQLLTFARKQPMVARVLPLNDVVMRTHRMLQRVIGEHIRLELALDPRIRPVKMDEGQLEQVLLNLAVNARDAMPDGGTLTVSTHHMDTAGDTRSVIAAPSYVRLCVSDTGEGMPPEVAARVFEPFFTTKKPGRGTGIGLATVHGVVTQAGGVIEVHTALGQGTRFELVLPTTREKAEQSVPPVSSLPLGQERVALIEDQATVRTLAEQQLRSLGYRVTAFASAEDALAVLLPDGLDAVDLVITDVLLPGMNGAALVENLRRFRPELRVLYVSGYTDGLSLSRAADAHRTFLLSKPFMLKDLAEAVRRALDAAMALAPR